MHIRFLPLDFPSFRRCARKTAYITMVKYGLENYGTYMDELLVLR